MTVSVAEVMSERVVAVRRNAGFAEIVAVLRRCHIASLPVIDAENRVIGIVSEDDLLVREADAGRTGVRDRLRRRVGHRRRRASTAGELMTTPAVTVTAAMSAQDAARLMYRRRIHQLPVVDAETGRLRGILTRSDVLGVYDRPDDEIRREIVNAVIDDIFGLDPGRFTVTVDHGTVTISGEVERRSAIPELVAAIERVDGVIVIRNRLTYRWDDSSPLPPRPYR